jgi:hypothetical protein
MASNSSQQQPPILEFRSFASFFCFRIDVGPVAFLFQSLDFPIHRLFAPLLSIRERVPGDASFRSNGLAPLRSVT